MVKGGGMRGEGGHAWRRGGMRGMQPPHEIRPVIVQAVRILLECIIVEDIFYKSYSSNVVCTLASIETDTETDNK